MPKKVHFAFMSLPVKFLLHLQCATYAIFSRIHEFEAFVACA